VYFNSKDGELMTKEALLDLISQGEGVTIEFKECKNEVASEVYPTVCSFSNRFGGHIFMGVDDNGEIIGVNPKTIKDMRKNFSNMLNNPQKISPSLFLSAEEYEIDGKLILYVYVPKSSQVHTCSKIVYDRIEDADVDITKNTSQMAELYLRKQTLDGIQRVSVRSIIAREIVSNMLMHREYANPFPAKLIIEKSRIYTENANKVYRYGQIKADNFTPYPKNPIIANFFANIGRADELGSGVRNLYKYTKIYAGGDPLLFEDDIFKIEIPLEEVMETQTADKYCAGRTGTIDCRLHQ
jgi:predicted HTH transcriptional regulator